MSVKTHVAPGIGARLKEAREQQGMSQRELAFPGCTPVYICRIERGDRTPSLQVAEVLASKLGVSLAWLRWGHQPEATDYQAELAELRAQVRYLADDLLAAAIAASTAGERLRELVGPWPHEQVPA